MAQQYNNAQLTSYVDQLQAKVVRLEAQLQLVSEKVGVPMEDPTAGLPPEVVELARSGERLAAVAKYRELVGGDLAEAQAAIASL